MSSLPRLWKSICQAIVARRNATRERESRRYRNHHRARLNGFEGLEGRWVMDAAALGIVAEIGTITVQQTAVAQPHIATLQSNFKDPIILAGPLSSNGPDPAMVRVVDVLQTGDDNGTGDSFTYYIDEWLYLDRTHTSETFSFIAVERGRHLLEGGLWLEAGSLEMNLDLAAGDGWFTQTLDTGFLSTPVVFSQLSSANGPDPAVLQQRDVSTSGFQVKIREEEKRDNWHVTETVSWLAIETGSGMNNGNNFFVGHTGDVVTDKFHSISFDNDPNGNPAFNEAPALLAAMQTTDGSDTANIRYDNLTNTGVKVQIDEEKSKDKETKHTTEDVGYFVWQLADAPYALVKNRDLMDIDTDSNNDGQIESFNGDEDANEDMFHLDVTKPGKRIFINTDDDNKNGTPDRNDIGDDYGVGEMDKDFAEIKLSIDPAVVARFLGHELWLGVNTNLAVWADTSKTPIQAVVDGDPPKEIQRADDFPEFDRDEDWYIWDIDADFPASLYIEGKELGNHDVFWRLVKPEKTFFPDLRDTVTISVEQLVWPGMDQVDNWQLKPTSTWDGVNVADAWHTEKALVDYITTPGDKGSIATIHPNFNNGTMSKDGPGADVSGEDSTSTDTYKDGFTLEFDYTFDRSRGDGTLGYVPIDRDGDGAGAPQHKLSFVGNSGIKFGTHADGPRAGKAVEASILDIEAMVNLAGGIEKFKFASDPSHPEDPSKWIGINVNENNEVEVRIPRTYDGEIPTSFYEVEDLNQLMSGIAYGQPYEDEDAAGDDILDYKNADADANGDDTDGNPSWERYYNALVANLARANNKMKVDVTRIGKTDRYDVTIELNGVKSYEYKSLAINNLGTFAVQSHWGSGVVFNNMKITEKE